MSVASTNARPWPRERFRRALLLCSDLTPDAKLVGLCYAEHTVPGKGHEAGDTHALAYDEVMAHTGLKIARVKAARMLLIAQGWLEEVRGPYRGHPPVQRIRVPLAYRRIDVDCPLFDIEKGGSEPDPFGDERGVAADVKGGRNGRKGGSLRPPTNTGNTENTAGGRRRARVVCRHGRTINAPGDCVDCDAETEAREVVASTEASA